MKTKINIQEMVRRVISCGDCAGLNREALRGDKPCCTEGRLSAERVCPQFKANVFTLSDSMKKGTQLRDLLDLFSHLEDSDIKTVAGLFLKELETRSTGHRLGERVYVRYRGKDSANYASNFCAARILDVTKTRVRIISDDGTMTANLLNSGFNGPTIYSEKAFAAVRKAFVKKNLAIDPEIELDNRKRNSTILEGKLIESGKLSANDLRGKLPNGLDGFVIPKMEQVVGKSKKNATKSTTASLIDIARIVDSGEVLVSKADEAGVTKLSGKVRVTGRKTIIRKSGGKLSLDEAE